MAEGYLSACGEVSTHEKASHGDKTKERTMSTNNSQGPETKAEGELSEEQESEVSGGIGSQSSGAGAGKVTFNPF